MKYVIRICGPRAYETLLCKFANSDYISENFGTNRRMKIINKSSILFSFSLSDAELSPAIRTSIIRAN